MMDLTRENLKTITKSLTYRLLHRIPLIPIESNNRKNGPFKAVEWEVCKCTEWCGSWELPNNIVVIVGHIIVSVYTRSISNWQYWTIFCVFSWKWQSKKCKVSTVSVLISRFRLYIQNVYSLRMKYEIRIPSQWINTEHLNSVDLITLKSIQQVKCVVYCYEHEEA